VATGNKFLPTDLAGDVSAAFADFLKLPTGTGLKVAKAALKKLDSLLKVDDSDTSPWKELLRMDGFDLCLDKPNLLALGKDLETRVKALDHMLAVTLRSGDLDDMKTGAGTAGEEAYRKLVILRLFSSPATHWPIMQFVEECQGLVETLPEEYPGIDEDTINELIDQLGMMMTTFEEYVDQKGLDILMRCALRYTKELYPAGDISGDNRTLDTSAIDSAGDFEYDADWLYTTTEEEALKEAEE